MGIVINEARRWPVQQHRQVWPLLSPQVKPVHQPTAVPRLPVLHEHFPCDPGWVV